MTTTIYFSDIYSIEKSTNIKQCNDYKYKKYDGIIYKIEYDKEQYAAIWLNNPNNMTKSKLYEFCQTFYNNSDIDDECISKLKNDFILLELDSLSVLTDVKAEEKEYSFSNLLSDIGGLLGLWLGMSVMGTFEIF